MVQVGPCQRMGTLSFGNILKCFHDNLGKQLPLVEIFDLGKI